MSQLVAGLAGIKAFKAKKEAEREARDRPRANYFNWKNNKSKDDKNVLYVRFLQEWETHIEGYEERFGVPLMAVEHQAPGKEGYKRRANCTLESEGQCYACERHSEDYKLGWGQKNNFYTWVLVDYNDGEGPQPVVLSRSLGSTFVDDLVIEVESDDENRITNKMWKITKTGSGKTTAWKLREAKGIELYDNTDVELPGTLEQSVLRPISYDEQAAYYGAVYKSGDPLDSDDDEAPAAAKENTTKQQTGELEW